VKGKDKDAAPQLSPGELRDLLAQATKGIAALAAQSGETDQSGSDAKKSSPPKKDSGACGSGKGKYRRYTGRKQDPKVDPCRNCNEMGHWAKDCPKPKQPAKEQVQASSISCQLVSPTRVYVTAYVDGKPVQCLLDSGCEQSVISRNVVPRAKLTRTRYDLTVADKASLSILGDTDLCFEIEGNRFRANVSVSPAIDDFLLGSDWLEANGAKWDFATGTLQLGDCVIRAYRRTLGKMCRQITVSEDFTVPARHEANVPVQMADGNIPHPAKNWVIETKQLSSRVMTARTLVDGKQERMVARVCNYSNEPFELRANYCLARAEPVEYISRSGEKPRSEWCIDKGDVNILSVSTGTVETTDSPPTAGRDPVATSSATTVGASTTAAGADIPVVDATTATEVPPPTD